MSREAKIDQTTKKLNEIKEKRRKLQYEEIELESQLKKERYDDRAGMIGKCFARRKTDFDEWESSYGELDDVNCQEYRQISNISAAGDLYYASFTWGVEISYALRPSERELAAWLYTGKRIRLDSEPTEGGWNEIRIEEYEKAKDKYLAHVVKMLEEK